jgi:hypothetical protein
MPLFRVYRMKDSPRQQFRWAPHVSGCAAIKLKDYEPCGEIAALHEYDAWKQLRESGGALQVGDLLEAQDGRLRICKYVGFEPAQWVVPEPKAILESAPAASTEPAAEMEPAGQSAAT